MIVDLPEPVGPTRKTNSPRRDRERRAVEPDAAALVELRDAAELDDRRGRRALGAARRGSRGAARSSRRHGESRRAVSRRRRAMSRLGQAAHASRRRRTPACNGFCRFRGSPSSACSGATRRLSCARDDRDPHAAVPNGLPIHRIALPGTRALTVLVAFDAGRAHRAPGGERHGALPRAPRLQGRREVPDYRDVNETAERLGGVLNAYTSHDLVAFHITVRAESAPEAIDLLTDFVGRPRIDAEELDRERGVVIQEIDRAYDQPSTVAEHLIDRAAFGEHPLGRTVLGPEEHLRTRSPARRSSPSASAAGRARAAARSSSATSTTCPRTASWTSCSAASRRSPEPEPYEPAPALRAARRSSRSATPTSRTCG